MLDNNLRSLAPEFLDNKVYQGTRVLEFHTLNKNCTPSPTLLVNTGSLAV